jgi:glyoxylase-like metal-dependent hydrolase (beta-lactamase superfamily II)
MNLRESIFLYPGFNGMDFSGEIDSNSIILAGPEGHMLVDPGLAPRWGELKEAIKADGLDPMDIKLVFLTHAHPDHAEAVNKCFSELGAKAAVGFKDFDFLCGPGRDLFQPRQDRIPGARGSFTYELPWMSIMSPVFPGPFSWGGLELRLFETRGHSPGGLAVHWPERGLLIVGDNFFPGTIGAFDLPGGSFSSMERTIKILRGLQDVDLVICGHGAPIEGRKAILGNYVELFEEIEDKKRKMAEKEQARGWEGA